MEAYNGISPVRLRVMVVDDEARICNGVARFLAQRYSGIEICKQGNGFDALAAMDASLPDLLITDLRMPEMDGLELIERAAKKGVGHYIILTGYDEFELMQRAIRLRAQDYLLKPVDKEQLFSAVESVWQAERKAQLNALREMVVYRAEGGDAEKCERLLFGEGESCFLLLFTKAAALLQSPSVSALGSDSEGNSLYILPAPLEGSPEIIKDIESGKQAGASYAKCPATAQALRAAYAGLISSELDEQELRSAYRLGAEQPALLTGALDKLLYPCATLPAKAEKLSALIRLLGLHIELWRLLPLLSGRKGLSERIAEQLIQPLFRDDALSDTVRKICAYVKSRYREEISAITAANEVFVTPNYLSTIFHQETGMTFTNYVNLARVDSACLILLQKEHSMDEIALAVGFSNTNYFFKVFHQVTGMTPGEYRKAL